MAEAKLENKSNDVISDLKKSSIAKEAIKNPEITTKVIVYDKEVIDKLLLKIEQHDPTVNKQIKSLVLDYDSLIKVNKTLMEKFKEQEITISELRDINSRLVNISLSIDSNYSEKLNNLTNKNKLLENEILELKNELKNTKSKNFL